MNFVRKAVSQKRHRFNDEEFNLDLTYILHNVIAMGLPSQGVEGMYRNHIRDVSRMLEKYHPNCYLLFNVSDRSYPPKYFKDAVTNFGFRDHYNPPMYLLVAVCQAIHGWLRADESHVAAVHCVAGKGRTGTVVSAYLIYVGMFKRAFDALTYFAKKRSTKTDGSGGVTWPSQRRYCYYLEDLLIHRHVPLRQRIRITDIILHTVPCIDDSTLGYRPCAGLFHVDHVSEQADGSQAQYSLLGWTDMRFVLPHDLVVHFEVDYVVRGDVLLSVTNGRSQTELFRAGFSTAMLTRYAKTDSEGKEWQWVLDKRDLCRAYKDPRFSDEFKVEVHFTILDSDPTDPIEIEGFPWEEMVERRADELAELDAAGELPEPPPLNIDHSRRAPSFHAETPPPRRVKSMPRGKPRAVTASGVDHYIAPSLGQLLGESAPGAPSGFPHDAEPADFRSASPPSPSPIAQPGTSPPEFEAALIAQFIADDDAPLERNHPQPIGTARSKSPVSPSVAARMVTHPAPASERRDSSVLPGGSPEPGSLGFGEGSVSTDSFVLVSAETEEDDDDKNYIVPVGSAGTQPALSDSLSVEALDSLGPAPAFDDA